jgi:glycosyltransferase involved in cell wall biosynthesis
MVRNLAHSLVQHGIETHVATTDDNGPESLRVPYGVPVIEEGVTYWFFPRQARFYTVSWPLTSWLSRHVREFDVVHIHALFSFATLAAAYCASRHSVPYIVRPLGTLNEWGMKHRRPFLKRLSLRFLERRVLDGAALVHYTSDQERVEAETLLVKSAAAIIPNALPDRAGEVVPGRFRSKYPELTSRQIILFLSRLDEKKGLDLLLTAFASVRQQLTQATLVIAGTGDPGFVADLKARASSLGIVSDVLWAGFLEGDAKQAALADSDIFVLPSYSENFGIAAAEGMAAGLPVIVSDQVAIHGDVTRARAGLVVPCDAGELTTALVRLLRDVTLRRRMGEDGQSFVRQNYSNSAVTRKVIAAYNQIATPTARANARSEAAATGRSSPIIRAKAHK